MEKMKMSFSDLPPGFRFSPTDQELIIHYLKQKVSFPSSNAVVSTIADVDIYKFNPWDLPGKALFGENEWFFFSPRDRKYPNGARPNRAAASGYWKATGTDKPILCSGGSQCLGVKKALVFYRGRPPKGIKTNWMMLEYRLLDDNNPSYRIRGSMRLDDWVLCRIRQKRTTLQKREQNYDLNSGFSIQPQGQKILQYNDLLEYGNGFQAYLMDPIENEEAEEHEQKNNKKGSQKGSDSSVETNLQAQVVSSFNEALESIKKTLSFGALDELVALPPKKGQQTSAPNEADGENIFHVPSLIPPASFPLCFSDFMS